MICKECDGGHLWPYRGRGYKYDTGHWYRKNFARPEDYSLTCKLTPWMVITIYACPRALPWNTEPHFIIILAQDQSTRIELRGSDVNLAKRKALEAVGVATAKAQDIASQMLGDLAPIFDPKESFGLKRLRRDVTHAETLLSTVTRGETP